MSYHTSLPEYKTEAFKISEIKALEMDCIRLAENRGEMLLRGHSAWELDNQLDALISAMHIKTDELLNPKRV